MTDTTAPLAVTMATIERAETWAASLEALGRAHKAGASAIICAHYDDGVTSDPENGMFTGGKPRCLFSTRNWSPSVKPVRCDGCPDALVNPDGK